MTTQSRPGGRVGGIRFVVYSLLPAVVLVAVAETVARVGGLATPLLKNDPFAHEKYGAMQADSELMWSLSPNFSARLTHSRAPEGFLVSTNSLGLRCREVGPKGHDEIRVLSLGESTTYGAYVGYHETYSGGPRPPPERFR